MDAESQRRWATFSRPEERPDRGRQTENEDERMDRAQGVVEREPGTHRQVLHLDQDRGGLSSRMGKRIRHGKDFQFSTGICFVGNDPGNAFTTTGSGSCPFL